MESTTIETIEGVMTTAILVVNGHVTMIEIKEEILIAHEIEAAIKTDEKDENTMKQFRAVILIETPP